MSSVDVQGRFEENDTEVKKRQKRQPIHPLHFTRLKSKLYNTGVY